jgi:large subunit ribosomal protein L1
MVEYRTDRFANVHVLIGKASFDESALLMNLRALVGELERVKPASAKGKYVKKVVVSTTMGPGVRIEPSNIAGSEA